MLDYIIGIAFLPVSILMFLNMFGITHLEKILGIPVMLIGALGLVVVQVVNIMSAHINKEFVATSWILSITMMWPTLIYLTSIIISYPASLISALPAIIASFLFVEGIYSCYIDHQQFK